MNIYLLTVIDGKIVDLSDLDTVMVHGSENYNKAITMMQEGSSLEETKKFFCQNCGNYKKKDEECHCMEDQNENRNSRE